MTIKHYLFAETLSTSLYYKKNLYDYRYPCYNNQKWITLSVFLKFQTGHRCVYYVLKSKKTTKHFRSVKHTTPYLRNSILIKAQDKNKSQKFVSEQLFKQ